MADNLRPPLRIVILALGIAAWPALATRAQTADSSIDGAFAAYSASTPGCAVGIERAGQPVLERAYGAADLERGVPNRVDTVFEAGSVSKQFTAASILLLVQDGRLSLHDSVRKYIPELPNLTGPITLAELLGHTSGLRDWGGVATPATPVRPLWLIPWPIATFPARLRPPLLRGILRWPNGRDCMRTIAPARR